jgi:hypothetical protein
MEFQNFKKIALEESIFANQFNWYQEINPSFINFSEFSNADKERVAIAEFFRNQQRRGRILYFLTTTYLPSDGLERRRDLVDDIFKTFYTRAFLPFLLQTNRYHKTQYKAIQPVTYTFTEAHKPKRVKSKVVDGYGMDALHEYKFPLRLHHHSILAVHRDHEERLDQLLGENTFVVSRFSKKIMTSYLQKADARAALYASKMWRINKNFMSFPDKLRGETEKSWMPNKYRLQHQCIHPLRMGNGKLFVQ